MAVEDSVSSWAALTSWLTPRYLFVFLNLTIGTIAVLSSVAARRKHHRLRPPPLLRAPSLLDRVRSFNFTSHYAPELADPAPPDSAFQSHADESTQLARAPSVVQRLRSLNLWGYAPELADPSPPDSGALHSHAVADESTKLARAPSLVERLKPSNFCLNRYAARPEPAVRVADPAGKRESAYGDGAKIEAESGEVTARRMPEKMKRSTTTVLGRRAAKEEKGDVERRRPATARERGGGRTAEDEGVDARADDFINRFKQQLKLQRLNSVIRYREMINRGSGPSGK